MTKTVKQIRYKSKLRVSSLGEKGNVICKEETGQLRPCVGDMNWLPCTLDYSIVDADIELFPTKDEKIRG